MQQKQFNNIYFTHIVRDLQQEGLSHLTRATFYRLIRRYKWPVPPKAQNGWRTFGLWEPKTPEDKARVSAPYYKALLKRHYNIAAEIPPRPEGLIDYDIAKEQGLI